VENCSRPCAVTAEIMLRPVSGAGGLDHRDLADGRPGGAGVVVRADPGLVAEVDRRPCGYGLGADRRELLGLPALHGVGIGLPGSPQSAQAQGAQQQADAHRRRETLNIVADPPLIVPIRDLVEDGTDAAAVREQLR
jgi:hypothetical protein